MPEPERRNTRQRRAVEAGLRDSGDFVSAQELHAQLRNAGESIGLATVYRSLAWMADAGAVDMIRSEDGEARYRLCASAGHHHHLVCRVCGRTVEVEAPSAEAWAREVAAHHGFADVTHTIEIFGTCADCSRT